jgi:hypothetical protein
MRFGIADNGVAAIVRRLQPFVPVAAPGIGFVQPARDIGKSRNRAGP